MKKFIIIISVTVAAVGACSCGKRQVATAGNNVSVTGTPATAAEVKDTLPSVQLPVIPSIIADENARMEYALLHYWDDTDFSDPRWESHTSIMEEAFARFIALANVYPDPDTAGKAVRILMKRAQQTASPRNYDMMTELADKYLYDPNSPLRNEELYIVVLESLIGNDSLEEVYKIAPRERLRMSLKNRVGTKAGDFGFISSTGAKVTLYGLKADWVVLFFYNLGCPACREVREEMMAVLETEPLASMMHDGSLKVIAVYPDEDMSQWKSYAEDIPAEWINACDPAQRINGEELYDLRAIPSLYLLDRNKTVLLKDFTDPSLIYEAIISSGE